MKVRVGSCRIESAGLVEILLEARYTISRLVVDCEGKELSGKSLLST